MDEENQIKDDDSIFDISIFKSHIRTKLILLFDSIPGRKILLIDELVKGPLNLSIEYPTLRDHGIYKIFPLDSDEVEIDANEIIFFVFPQPKLMKRISRIIHGLQNTKSDRTFHLIFWPRRNVMCVEALVNQGVYGNLLIKDFSFDLIPVERGLFSLEIDTAYKQIYLDKDYSIFSYVAEALDMLQLTFNQFKWIFGKGNGAKVKLLIIQIVLDILDNYKLEGRKYEPVNNDDIELEGLFIFDREIDLITPLCTQLTYQGLIDEIFGIKNNVVTLEQSIVNSSADKPVSLLLTETADPVFKEIKDMNFSVLRNFLTDKVNLFKSIIDDKGKERSVQEMNAYLQKFKQIQKEYSIVTNHINIAENISNIMKTPTFHKNMVIEQGILIGAKPNVAMEHVELFSALNEDFNKMIRILCLQSLVENGLKKKNLDFLKKELIHNYGSQKLVTLENLERLGLLKQQDKKGNWSSLEKNLRLINEDVKASDTNDPAYAYSGYSPLTLYLSLFRARLVESAFTRKGWKGIMDSLSKINGPTIFDEKAVFSQRKTAIVVFIIGGVTYSEAAAIKTIGKKFSLIHFYQDKEIIISSTNILSGNNLIKMVDDIES